MIIFSERLKELRNEKGLNQRDFSKMLNITQPTLCRWETGDREPDFVMLEKLCRFFDVSADYLLGIENEDGSKNTEYEFNYQHKNTKLIHKEKKI